MNPAIAVPADVISKGESDGADAPSRNGAFAVVRRPHLSQWDNARASLHVNAASSGGLGLALTREFYRVISHND